MTTSALTSTSVTAERSATKSRMAVLAVVLGITAIVVIPAGVIWPEPAGGGETYSYADIADQRGLWWGLLTFLAIIAVVGTILQAVATMFLVRHRGSTWATVGAVLMGIGIVAQGIGVAGWATAYFFPTDPDVDPAAGQAVFEAVNDNIGYIFAVMLSGALLALIGQVLQAVGLFRAKVVPTWVPVASLFAVLTFVVPGNGLLGLITAIPMSAAGMALGWYAYRSAS